MMFEGTAAIKAPYVPSSRPTERVSLRQLINPSPKQDLFISHVKNRSKRYLLYGGAAGGGKSYILRWMLVFLLIKWWQELGLKGVRVGLFCEDYPALEDRQISKIKLEFPEWLGTYKDKGHEFHLAKSLGGGVICFRNLDDPTKYLSAEFAAIAVDELTKNELEVFTFLRMRLRWPGIEDTKFLAATNPGSIGHGWVKGLWKDGLFPEELKDVADQFAFVQALATDNPHNASSYIEQLNSLPEHERKIYRDGNWDTFAGQVFGEFDRSVHVCRPFRIPAHWPVWRAMDWGFTKPYCVLWFTMSPEGVIYIIRELYGMVRGKPNAGVAETARQVRRQVAEVEASILDEHGHKVKVLYGVADPACWAKTGVAGTDEAAQSPSVIDEFCDSTVKGVPVITWSRGQNDRMQGKQQLHLRLRGWNYDEEAKKVTSPALVMFDCCTHTIRTIPALVYDEHKIEDVDTDGEDHPYDTVRYGIMERLYTPVKKEKRKRDAWADDDRDDEEGGADSWQTA